MPSSYFRAVAMDFDGTLTEGARPDDAVLEAIARGPPQVPRLQSRAPRLVARLPGRSSW